MIPISSIDLSEMEQGVLRALARAKELSGRTSLDTTDIHEEVFRFVYGPVSNEDVRAALLSLCDQGMVDLGTVRSATNPEKTRLGIRITSHGWFICMKMAAIREAVIRATTPITRQAIAAVLRTDPTIGAASSEAA
jgi:hypothetical protein